MKKRVVITGLGALTPVGNNIEETWSNLVQGVSGVDLIKNFDTSALPVKIAAQVKNFKPEQIIDEVIEAVSNWPVYAASAGVPEAAIKAIRSTHRLYLAKAK